MNRLCARFVSGLALLIALLLAGTLQASCISVDGGAIEAAWIINTAQGGLRINCDCARFGAVRMSLVPFGDQGPKKGAEDPCANQPSCRFDCEGGAGTTEFVIPAGSYSIGLVPAGFDGKDITSAQGVVVPPPLLRQVREGEVTNLGANLFVVELQRLAGKPACKDEWLNPL